MPPHPSGTTPPDWSSLSQVIGQAARSDLALGTSVLCRHFPTQQLHLFQYGLCRLLLFVGRVTVLAEDSFHDYAQLRVHVLAHGPIDRDVFADRVGDFARDCAQGFVAENLYRAVVSL